MSCPHGGKNKASCKECARAWHQEFQKNHRSSYLFRAAKARAKRKGIEFSINEEHIVVPAMCPVLGIPLDSRTRAYAPSVDRRDLDRGYEPGNVFVISGRANRLKSNATVGEIEAILKYMKKRTRKGESQH